MYSYLFAGLQHFFVVISDVRSQILRPAFGSCWDRLLENLVEFVDKSKEHKHWFVHVVRLQGDVDNPRKNVNEKRIS